MIERPIKSAIFSTSNWDAMSNPPLAPSPWLTVEAQKRTAMKIPNPSQSTVWRLFAAVLLLARAGISLAATHYVDITSTNATPPYINWTTAATNIQNAVDVAVAGDEVVVTNGVYAPVYVNASMILRSVNGPQGTIVSAGGNGRCAWLTNGANLSGFSLINGSVYAGSGGGAYGGTLNNCWLIHNAAFADGFDGAGNGGGAAYCALNNCIIVSNSADTFMDTTVLSGDYGDGGGAYHCTLSNCTLSSNSANITFAGVGSVFNGTYACGGGAAYCTLNNCALTANTAEIAKTPSGSLVADAADGGGTYICTLNNCTVTGNSAQDIGGGVYNSSLTNCIVYFNSAPSRSNVDFVSIPAHCWTSDPLFIDYAGGNLRLQSNSPCINAGDSAFVPAGPDLDGNPRIVGSTVDIGAYEYQSLSLINFGVVSDQAAFNITGQSNQVVIVETSSDLRNWSPLATNTLSGHPFSFTDPTPATLPQRFYRAKAQ